MTAYWPVGKEMVNTYHAEGELCVIGKDILRDYFLALQPVFKAIGGFNPNLDGYVKSALPFDWESYMTTS